MGLVTGACFAEFGVNVTCVDKDENKIKILNQGGMPIFEPGLKELMAKNVQEGRLKFTTDAESAIRKALVIFIAVGTPSDGNGRADLKYVRQVANAIAQDLNGYKVIATKSTVPVGTGEMIAQIIRDKQVSAYGFDVVSNPEFLREGTAVHDFHNPAKTVHRSTKLCCLSI